jgi:cytochrome c-type biogenesis protein CcmF
LPFVFGEWHALVGFGLALAAWIVLTAILSFRKRWKQTRSHYGMALAHIGVAVFVVGVTLVKGYESDTDVKIRAGETVQLAGYVFRFDGVSRLAGPNYDAMQARIVVTRNGKPVTVMHPERRVYTVQEQVMTEAAIDPGVTRDLYVSLGDPLDDAGTWLLKVQHKPFVDWIWGGCLLMALGGLLAASDRRYRISLERKTREARVAA